MRLLLSLTIFIISQAAWAGQSIVNQRLEQEKKLESVNFSLTPYKPTYLLPLVFNNKINSYDRELFNDDTDMQQLEVEFQISFRVPVWQNIADLPLSLNVAYTQISLWQAYNTKNSSPFRETNYEPEVFFSWQQDRELSLGWTFKMASAGFSHQSNGRTDPISRSWNRLNANFIFEKDNLVIGLNTWYRFEESASKDNNPDLLDYYGHSDARLVYKLNNHTISVMSRNNIESGFSKGALEASWSFPIHNKVHGYLKLFSGYGNSMIEYDRYTNTIGIGISITDWL